MTTPKLEKEIHCKSIIMRTALMAFGIVAPMCLGAVSPAFAPKALEAIRNCIRLEKIRKTGEIVVDGAKALKNGEKVYRAVDLAKDSVHIGEGMLGKLADGVADDVVKECAKRIRERIGGGGKFIDDVIPKSMDGKARNLLLSDAYLRSLKEAGKLSAEEADEAFRLLKDTEGLSGLVRKCCSANKTVTGSHYELRQALAFRKKGFDVIGVGIKYSDGIKSRPPDLDILVRKGKDLFLVESKHYTDSNIWREKPSKMVDYISKTADGLSNLKAFLNSELGGTLNARPIFTFVKEPPADVRENLLKKGIPCFVGKAEDIAELLAVIH